MEMRRLSHRSLWSAKRKKLPFQSNDIILSNVPQCRPSDAEKGARESRCSRQLGCHEVLPHKHVSLGTVGSLSAQQIGQVVEEPQRVGPADVGEQA